MRNSTITPVTFEHWLAKQAPGAIALPMPGGSAAPQQRLPAPRLDEQRLADLANEILATAIELAVALEASRQAPSTRGRNTMRPPAATGGATDNLGPARCSGSK